MENGADEDEDEDEWGARLEGKEKTHCHREATVGERDIRGVGRRRGRVWLRRGG